MLEKLEDKPNIFNILMEVIPSEREKGLEWTHMRLHLYLKCSTYSHKNSEAHRTK